MKIEESLNVTFDETPLPSRTSPLVDDDLDEEEVIKVTKKKNLENNFEDETLEINEVVNIKEMLLTRLFTHIVSNFPELSDDRYILCDHVMHPLAPHYEQNTRSDHGIKRCRQSNPSSFSNVLDHSSSHHVDENDEESSQSNTPPPS
ncbi:hypothetical protein Tco_0600099 [Tanacetum coccineum]|uniref:Uncharacterized protein n=1 Tax=Tanacetum coccineum TaxID=301880 RepID=A0ABQ4WAU5_9ASTR